MSEVTGLLAEIFKPGGKSYSNGGVSTRYDEVLVVGGGIEGPFKEREGLPVVTITLGRAGNLIAVETLGWEAAHGVRGKTVGPMFGGTFVWSTDARFRRISEQPIPLHDRFETPEQYAQMST